MHFGGANKAHGRTNERKQMRNSKEELIYTKKNIKSKINEKIKNEDKKEFMTKLLDFLFEDLIRRANRRKKILRPLSTLRHRFSNLLLSVLVILKRWSIPLLFLATIVLFFYMICDQLGFVDYFLSVGYQVSLRLGFRTLSFFLIQMGCSSGLALATGFVVTGLLTAGGEPTINHMQPAGGSSTAESFPSLSSIEKLPSISNDRDEVEQPVPDLETQRKDMTKGLDSFLSSFNKRAVKGHYLMTIYEQLHLDTASEENLNRIKAAMEIVSSREGAERPTSARKAGTALLTLLKDKEGGSSQ